MNSSSRLYLPLIVASFFLAVGPIHVSRAEKEPQPPTISYLTLFAHARDFDGKKLSVSGWLYCQVEDGQLVTAYLFPTPDHVRVHDFPSAANIEAATFVKAFKEAYPGIAVDKLHNAYIVFTATFHLGLKPVIGNRGIGEFFDVTAVLGVGDIKE